MKKRGTQSGLTTSREAAPSPETPGWREELANSVSHGVGLMAALVAVPVLIVVAARRGEAAGIVGASVFGGTLILLFLASTLYHGLPGERAKRVFKVLDHQAIYLLIAGSYTPFMLGALRGAWGWALLSLVWAIAVAGVVLKGVGRIRRPALSTGLYLAMGWMLVVAARPLLLHVPAWVMMPMVFCASLLPWE